MKKHFFLFSLLLLSCQDDQFMSFNSNNLDSNSFSLENNEILMQPNNKNIHIDNEILNCLVYNNSCHTTYDIILVFDDSPNSSPTDNINFKSEGSLKYLNNEALTEQDEQQFYRYLEQIRIQTLKNIIDSRQNIINTITNLGINLKQSHITNYLKGHDALHTELSISDIKTLLTMDKLLGIELYIPPSDDSLQTAMQATFVTQGASFVNNHGGENIGIYMSELGCPPDNYISNYERIIGSDTNHSRSVSSILRTIAPNSYIYCRSGCQLPTTDMLISGAFGNTPDIILTNFSCSSGTSDSYTAYSKTFDDFVYNTNVTVITAATNNGNTTGYLSTQGLAMNVITVGNYNDYSNTPSSYTINSTSSYKNAVDIKSAKPELSAPGTSINSGTDTNGNTITMTGTSQATSHVTAMLANIGSGWSSPTVSSVNAIVIRAMALSGARDSVQGGYDKVGVGGADFYKMYDIHSYGWYGGDFVSIAANDGNNNNVIDNSFITNSSTTKARLVVSWLNRGTWVYAHKNDTFPAGADYGIIVYDPDGNVIATHWNPFDGFAVLDFNTPKIGEYKFQISRTANRDTAANFKMAWVVTFN